MHFQYYKFLKKHALILLAAILITIQGTATEKPPTEEPRLNFPYVELSENEIDLGELSYGVSATGTITLYNIGAKPLLIATVRSSCGMMTPSWPTSPIGAGEQVSVSFRYDSSRPGPFERIITIHTNAWQKTLKVKVFGEIIPQGEEMPE